MTNNKIVNHIRKNNKSLPEYNFGSVQVIVKDALPQHVDISAVFDEIISVIPDHFLELIDIIYIGEFDFLLKREVTSIYLDNAIYISNQQDNLQDMKDDIIHEVSHAVEDNYKQFIYEDGFVENEYFGKLRRLKSFLGHEGYDVNSVNFFNTKLNKDFDEYLYKDIGYEVLHALTNGLFLAPYSATSLQEYWARGFEEFYLGERVYLKTVCPYIYNKLQSLASENTEELEYEER